jgi:hypothetical protein
MIDAVELCEHRRRCYMHLKEFIKEDVLAVIGNKKYTVFGNEKYTVFGNNGTQ